MFLGCARRWKGGGERKCVDVLGLVCFRGRNLSALLVYDSRIGGFQVFLRYFFRGYQARFGCGTGDSWEELRNGKCQVLLSDIFLSGLWCVELVYDIGDDMASRFLL